MSKCLITGGAGFIGSHLTEKLLEDGHEVTVLDNFSTGRPDNLSHVADHPRLTRLTGSITDHVLLTEAVRGQDIIYHLAAAVGVKLVADDPVRTIETNIYPTEWLLKLATQTGCRFFLASTSEVYGKNPNECWDEEEDLHFGPTSKPRWAYGCSKAIDEFLALAYHAKYGLPIVIGRFFNVVGPRQVGNYGMVIPRFVDQAMNGGPVIVYDDGQQVRCFAHVKEVIRCIDELVRSDEAVGRIFNIGSDRPVTIHELAKTVIEKVDSSVEVNFREYTEAYGNDFEDVRRRVPNVDRLQKTLGWKPSLTLSEILDDIIAWKKSSQ
ncbi:GDP-mannose 4,6-dehydratase [Thalassoglobus sp. JC818]|uniref:NAD-dependent epimerase/dehydratase family protein n=1 Tax=Thalassoglobus sp. JC818 TaxID=3232136 RepID=UPI0034582400